jgi:chromosome segregation protein
MKLEKLTLQGFKSFRDRTTIFFDNGVTGIVGPNGCGKSNIVDALFWVMGEQSAKHLRGDKMSDLIFNGTDKYSAASFAEVTLTLLNTHHKHIHIGQKVVQPEEIELSRKLYRNGETEYRINGMPARLKDIQEVFMDTGAGAKSYSVIAQGEIDRLVRAKPEDRRVMIDEVAGITKFKMRRKESLKKMEQTQQNLDRLSDLQKEVQKHLKDLEHQAGKAKRAKHLREKVQHHSLIVSSHKEHDYLEKFFSLKEKFISNVEAIENLKRENTSVEMTMEDEQLQKIELMEKVEAAQVDLTQVGKQLAGKEEEVRFAEKTLVEKRKHILERQDECEQVDTEVLERNERLQEVNDQLNDLLASNIESEDFTQLEQEVEQKKNEMMSMESSKNELSSQKQQAFYALQSVESSVYKHQSKLEQISSDLQEITQEIDLLEVQTGAFADENQGKRELLKSLEKKVADYKESKEVVANEIKEFAKKIETERLTIQLKRDAVVSLETKIQSLSEINDTNISKMGSIKFLQEEKNRSNNFTQIGKLVDADVKYSTAVQKTLNTFAECLIVNNTTGQAEILNWVTKNSENMDWCMPTDIFATMESSEVEVFKNEFIHLYDVARISNEKFEKLATYLFQNKWVSEGKTLEEVLKIAEGKKFSSIVDIEGKFFIYYKDGLLIVDCSFGDETSDTGMIERSIKIKEFEQQLVLEKKQLDVAQNTLMHLEQEKSAKENNLQNINEALEKSSEQFIAIRSEIQAQENGLQLGATRLEVLRNKKSDLSHQRLELLEGDDDIQNQKEAAQNLLDEIDVKLKDIDSKYLGIKKDYEQIREQYIQKKSLLQTRDIQEKSLKGQIADTELQISNLQAKKEHYLDLITKYENEITELEESLVINKQAISELLSNFKDLEELVSNLKESLDQVLEKVQDREKVIKENSKEITRLEKETMEAKLKCDQILEEEELLVRNTFEVYRVNLRSVILKFLNISLDDAQALRPLESMMTIESAEGPITLQAVEYEFEKKFPAQVKESQEKARRYNSELNSIGEINWTADEEFEKQKVRYNFLCEQEAELKTSLEDLTSAISLIDQKSILRFKMAYEEINDKFSKVFPIIFGGGSANLQLTSSPEDPECGVEIIAQPPGKKMQNINLMSGGEKALTAVSLIFSIFLIKPSPFCLLDEVDAPLDDANVGRFNELLREMSSQSQFILITHNKKTMELNDTLYGITMQEPGVSKALSVQLH